jgi:L-ascorbate metabolism protein UlaG (beta-lactamase superfamily)
VLLITHDHFDHLSVADLKKVVSENTVVVAARECQGKFGGVKMKEVKFVKPGDKLTVLDVSIEAVPAYNLNKSFHPKQDGKVGYVVQMGGVRVYHTGDSDHVPEMSQVKADIALLPVSGTYVMTAEEAAEAAKALRPKLAIPMHYGTIVGSEADAKRFEQLAKGICEVKVLRPE